MFRLTYLRTSYIRKVVWQVGNILKVWWEVLCGFCWKFVSSGTYGIQTACRAEAESRSKMDRYLGIFFSAVSLWVVVRRARVWAGARSSHVAGDVASPARAGSDRTSPGGAKLTTSYSIRSHSSSSDRYDVGGRHCIMPVRSRSGVDVGHRVSIPLGPEIIAGHVACPPQTSRSRL